MIRVTRSAVIDAPIETVWAVLRDFNSHWYWHPIIDSSEIEDGEPSDRIGCVRQIGKRTRNRASHRVQHECERDGQNGEMNEDRSRQARRGPRRAGAEYELLTIRELDAHIEYTCEPSGHAGRS